MMQQANAPAFFLQTRLRVGTSWGENRYLKNWPELEAERVGAGQVKQAKPILVILGNPPYNAFAGVSPAEEEGLVEPYKEGLGEKWGIKKFNLDELYVRFLRLAERKIAEKTGTGVICYISNYSYLGDPSFVVMRERLLREFDSLWFDSLNGDSRETGKLTPDGKPDPSVFSTDYNREGIRLGTAVGLMVRQTKRKDQANVFFREFWGVNKRADLLASADMRHFDQQYSRVRPEQANRFSYRPLNVSDEYFAWTSVVDLCDRKPISGLQEMRRGAFLDVEREKLANRMRAYYDPVIDWEGIEVLQTGLSKVAGGFEPLSARKRAIDAEPYDDAKLRRYALYPFDVRWCYYTRVPSLWNRPRPELVAQSWEGNRFFITRMFAERPDEQRIMTMTSALPDYHLLRPNAVAIPLRLKANPRTKARDMDDGSGEFSSIVQEVAPADEPNDKKIIANLSAAARAYLTRLGIIDLDADAHTAGLVWMHALAIGYSPAYLTENADGIRQDWPRIPLPESRARLIASAELGMQIGALLETEARLTGVDAGRMRPELMKIAVLTRVTNEPLNLSLTAGWGHPGQGGVTMPGRGKSLTRDYAADEALLLEKIQQLGSSTCDIYLNEETCWRNIPTGVWDYTIGGYQILKKWLSYREHSMLGRAITGDEAREFTYSSRRIAALLLLQPQLDQNYAEVKAAAVAWSDFAKRK